MLTARRHKKPRLWFTVLVVVQLKPRPKLVPSIKTVLRCRYPCDSIVLKPLSNTLTCILAAVPNLVVGGADQVTLTGFGLDLGYTPCNLFCRLTTSLIRTTSITV